MIIINDHNKDLDGLNRKKLNQMLLTADISPIHLCKLSAMYFIFQDQVKVMQPLKIPY